MHAVPLRLPSGRLVAVEVSSIDGIQPVAAIGPVALQDVVIAAGEIAEAMHGVIASASPDEAKIEFGIDLTLEAGQLTTLLVKGSGKGTLKISLTWKKPE